MCVVGRTSWLFLSVGCCDDGPRYEDRAEIYISARYEDTRSDVSRHNSIHYQLLEQRNINNTIVHRRGKYNGNVRQRCRPIL